MTFQPDYRHLLAAARNERPARLPLYEHLINDTFMEKLLGRRFADLAGGDAADRRAYFDTYCGFYRQMTYDTVSYEVCVTEVLPGGGALRAETPGTIQSRSDFERYPWKEVPDLFWRQAEPRFEALARALPAGMKAVGGIGNGPFEISVDLVGFERLCYVQADDPDLFADLYRRIGDLLLNLWETFLACHADTFAVCRIGDDMGFKTATLLAPETLRQHVVPQYRRIVSAIHAKGFPFLLHSCGKIFDVMDALMDAGIDAKHSNEDVIALFDEWIARYGKRIALFGGIDTDLLCRTPPEALFELVLERGARFRASARGYALGSGNSIPDYVPVEGYLALVRAAQELRRREGTS